MKTIPNLSFKYLGLSIGDNPRIFFIEICG